ncbi:MAG: two-component system NarL family sensor kinase [Flavobacteriales bacterium]|jgi:two-component system NarL family sensor kinase
MKFSSVKTVDELTPAIGSLDDASKEVRRIAHNMMPEVLMNYGLESALRDFVESVNQNSSLDFDLQLSNLKAFDQTQELMIYRIVQELINNVVKHANAKSVLIQLMQADDTLSITVEDDGCGFNVDLAMKKSGLGMSNLKARVEYLGGTLNIDSSENSGTSVFIEVPLNEQV